MPAFKPLAVVLQALNRANSQSFGSGDVLLQYSKELTDSSLALLAPRTGGTLVGTGQANVRYHRLSLATLLATSGITGFATRRITQQSLLLTTLAKNTGIVLTAKDIVGGAISYDANNQATVTFTAVDNHVGYSGSFTVTITANATDIDLADVITTRDYMTIDQDSTEYVKQLIQANTATSIDWSGITIGTPSVNTDTTASPRNAKATLTAIAGSGYTGSVTFYFDRTTSTVTDFPNLYFWPLSADWTGTSWQWLTQFHPDVAADYTEDQFNPTTFTIPAYTTTFTVPSGSVSGSWTTVGGDNIAVNPNNPNWYGTTDTVMAFDASLYNSAGFTDYKGLALAPQANAFNTAGEFMSGNVPNGPFAGGLSASKPSAILTKAGGVIAKTVYTGAWTFDCWVYNSDDVVLGNAIPLIPFTGSTNLTMSSYTDRLLSFHNGSSNGATYNGRWVLSNNAQNPRLSSPVDMTIGKKGWQHFAIVYDGVGSTKYYCNGKLLFTLSNWTIATATGNWFFGMGIQPITQTGMVSGIERWRFRTGMKFTGEFGVQDLYPQYFATKKALNTLVTKPSMGTLDSDTTDANFIKKVATFNGTRLLASGVVFSNPVTYTGAEGNTKITLTAVADGPYSGSVDVFFTRSAGTPVIVPDQFRFPDPAAFTGTQYSFLQKYFPSVLSTYFPSATSSDFTDAITLDAGALPVMTLSLAWMKYQSSTMVPIRVNPASTGWEGADLVMGWDSTAYVQDGFTDKAGNILRGYNNYAGTAGAYPVKANLPFAFGGALTLQNSMISTVATLPATTYSQAFTIDFWQYYPSVPIAGKLPFNPLYAAVNTSAFNANIRVQIGDANSTSNVMNIWNNAATAKIALSPDSAYRRAGWQHVAITYDGSIFKFYQDGVLILQSTAWTIVGGAWMLALFGTTLNGVSGSMERYRYRKGVKLAAGYTVKDLYPTS